MTETELKTLLSGITPPDEAARAAAHAHWAGLAKPLGGLGALETLLEDAAALTGSAALDVSRRAVLVLCSDNGVVAQGVSQTDQSVTRAVAENLAARRTSVCQMARTAHCDVVPVVMDGFISGVAALCAVRLCPAAAKAVFASHCSSEPAARLVLDALGKAPLLTAGLHLGEGTGAVASLPLWDMALAVYDHCYSFAEGGITPYTPQC